VARSIGGWLEGPRLPRDTEPGERLGLPTSGPGSIASIGRRLVAYLVDGIVANLLAGVPVFFGARYSADGRGFAVYAAFLLEIFLLTSILGQSVGMRVVGIRVLRLSDLRRPSWYWVAVRTVLLGLLVPPFVWDRDQRGLHDRAAGTVIVSER
jgi:uncharacterized RDD family membrane protein YckC